MSRQQGRRPTPARRPARPPPRQRRRRQAVVAGYDRRRFWIAATVGTLFAALTTWTFVLGAVALDEASQAGDEGSSIPILVAFALVPVAMFVMAKLTRRPDAMAAASRSIVGALGIGALVTFLAQDILSGFVAVFAVGGAIALPRPPGASYWDRAALIMIVTAFTAILARVVPALALSLGPLLALPALRLADVYSMRRLPPEPAQSAGE